LPFAFGHRGTETQRIFFEILLETSACPKSRVAEPEVVFDRELELEFGILKFGI
jgi:hypothetical protein